MTATADNNNAIWTAEDDATLRALYSHHSANHVARVLHRTRSAVRNRVAKLGLRKRENAGRFTTGHTTWNKGMKGLDIGGKETRFKAGSLPHTWRPIGHTRETKDGYLQRKVQDTRITRHDYVGIHHLVWRMHGRSIPAGHALVFRDGNNRNFDINNLELVSRADLMRRNTVHRLPKELAQLVQLRGALMRQINKHQGAPKQ